MKDEFIEVYCKKGVSRYIFGATEEAAALIKIHNENNLELIAVIDNFYSEGFFSGLPCIKLGDVPLDSFVVSAVTNSRPIDVNKLLEKHNFNYCDYFYFYRNSGFKCPDIDFWDGALSHWENNTGKYIEIKSWFEDIESIKTFDAIVSFRNSYDLNYMSGFKFDITNMYIEPFILPLEENCVFFDLGAFDGSDSERLLRNCPTASTYLFEPIPSQADMLTAKYKNNQSVNVIPVAVGDAFKLVFFSLSGTSSKVVSENASDEVVSVQQVSIDGFCSENNVFPTYVKMDVEGVELDVLHGMAETIVKCKPKLAISVYHRAEHIIAVPQYLKKLCPEYKFYLRHYTQGYSETVLFAV